MENIIKKAIEGGYASDRPEYAREHLITGFEGDFRFMVLDPLFWQALGKACGWGEQDRGTEYTPGGTAVHVFYGNTWEKYALRFHQINLTQSFDKAVNWLGELIK